MKSQMLRILVLLLVLGAGYGFGRQQPTVKFNGLAYYDLQGSRLSQTASKRINLVNFQYNDTVIPCLVVDTKASQLSNDLVGNASISCGWSDEAIKALTGK